MNWRAENFIPPVHTYGHKLYRRDFKTKTNSFCLERPTHAFSNTSRFGEVLEEK